MDMFRVEGGHRLSGRVTVEGSKNAALPIMAASLMVDGLVTLCRVPALQDVATMTRLLRSLGVTVEGEEAATTGLSSGRTLHIDAGTSNSVIAAWELVRQMRASICVLGPLLARFGRARVSLPGGCNIGHRPVDLHLKGLAALGADLRLENGYVVAEATRLHGADIVLCGPQGSTVTGTCNVMAAAATARGRTIIRSAACEPEVCDLGHFLIAAGARIDGLGSPVIEIQGVDQLGSVQHTVITDRIEAATLAVSAAITRGDIILVDAPLESMASVFTVLRETGVSIDILTVDHAAARTIGNPAVRITCPRNLVPVEIVAAPYPGLPTDAQAQLMALLCLVPGVSMITDRVFPDRFMHASELIRMGADIRVSAGTAVIRGQPLLTGAEVVASDLRASAALVLAALAAEGISHIHQVCHLDRGYAAFEQKLNSLGACIQRVPDDSES